MISAEGTQKFYGFQELLIFNLFALIHGSNGAAFHTRLYKQRQKKKKETQLLNLSINIL